jgi:hypothetical protein
MRKIFFFVLLGIIVFFSTKSLVHANRVDINELESCSLSDSKLILKILPSHRLKTGELNIRARVFKGPNLEAVGIKKFQVLSISPDGNNFEVPLSNKLAERREYQVSVIVEHSKKDVIEKEWSSVPVTSKCTNNDFFEKSFKAIPEPFNLRKKLGAIQVSKEIGIL